jgi:hypothetical protein
MIRRMLQVIGVSPTEQDLYELGADGTSRTAAQ